MCTEKSSLQIGPRAIPIEIECHYGIYVVCEAGCDWRSPIGCHEEKQIAIELFRESLEDDDGRAFAPRPEYRRDAEFSAILRSAQS